MREEIKKALPVRYIKSQEMISPTLDIEPNGRVTYRKWGGINIPEVNGSLGFMIDDYFKDKMAKKDYFWRGTDNKEEIELILSGTINPSINHADGTKETGLSVADHLGYIMTLGYKYGYRVKGKVVGYGSDGEPILDLKSLEVLDSKPRAIEDIKNKEEKEFFDNLKKVVKSEGWTWKQYQSATFAYLVESEEIYEKEYQLWLSQFKEE